MHDAVLVSVVQSVGHLPAQIERLMQGEPVLPLEQAPQRFPLDVGHDIVEKPIHLARIMERQDVGMGKTGGDPDLAEKALRPDRGAKVGLEDLDRHLASVLRVLGEVHRRHAAPAELALDQVPVAQGVSQFGSGPVDHGETWVGGTLRICADQAFLASAEGSAHQQAQP